MASIFPDDENGDVLRMMVANGDNLGQPREIDFSVIFPTDTAAMRFAVDLLREDLKVSFSAYEGNADFPWQVQSHPFMLPTHENISGFEAMLEEHAAPFGGKNDGWGCESQD
jgi:Regulator of ribonuclease activity B